MKRRSFLGFLGGAVAAGPKAVQAAPATMADLRVPDVMLGGSSQFLDRALPAEQGFKSEAKEQLKRLVGMSVAERQRLKNEHYIGELDPHVAACRSASLVTKIRMSRELDFERHQRRRGDYLQGVLDGLWGY